MTPAPWQTMPERPHVQIYTDGGCEPNPGKGGFGVVVLHPAQRMETSGGFRSTTNNRMEIYAAIAGLELLKEPSRVTLYSDSQYVVNAMTKGWAKSWQRKNGWRTKDERAANYDLWERVLALCAKHQVEFRWVRGHAGNVENERCDQLAMAALRGANLPADTGYENKSQSEAAATTAVVAAPAPPRELQEGDPCRKCSTPVIKQPSKSKPKAEYYYEYHLWCPHCAIPFQVEAAKRMIPQTGMLF